MRKSIVFYMEENVRLIIFDWDGTLADTLPVILDIVTKVIIKKRQPMKTGAEIKAEIGQGIREVFRGLYPDLAPEGIEKLVELYRELYLKNGVSKIKLFSGVKKVLENLKNKKMAVVSNKSINILKKEIKKLNIGNYFTLIQGNEDDGCQKPSPCPIQKVMSELAIDQEHTMMVGDMKFDVRSGKEAGVQTVGATYGIGKCIDLQIESPDYLIRDIKDLVKIVINHQE